MAIEDTQNQDGSKPNFFKYVNFHEPISFPRGFLDASWGLPGSFLIHTIIKSPGKQERSVQEKK